MWKQIASPLCTHMVLMVLIVSTDSSAHYFPTPRGSYYVKRLAYTSTIKPSGLNSETSCIIKALPTGFARCIKPTRGGGAAPPRLDFPSRTRIDRKSFFLRGDFRRKPSLTSVRLSENRTETRRAGTRREKPRCIRTSLLSLFSLSRAYN